MKTDAQEIDNCAIKSLIFENKGDFMPGHVHKFDHAHLVGRGRVLVQVDGEPDREFGAGEIINIKKHKAHKIIALTDNALSFCIHCKTESEMKHEGQSIFETVLI